MVAVDQTPKMVNTPDWPYGFYGLVPDNVGTFFAEGVPDTGRGRPTEASAAAMGAVDPAPGRAARLPRPDAFNEVLLDCVASLE